MSDHKRAGLHGAFSPSGLSGSNIHLAWCIPGLETLMWFVGKSRWQVHGSTLLTDSAGASGRVHNNTKCLSPPSSPLLSNHTSYFKLCINMYIFSFSDITLATGKLLREPSGMLTLSSALCVLQSLVFQPLLSLFMSHSLRLSQISTVWLHPTHSYCSHTHAHALWLHPPTPPLPSSFGSHSLHQSLSSFLFLHLVCSPPRFSRWAYAEELEILCLVLPLVCWNDVMHRE